MTAPIDQRILALAGLIQALQQVRRVAETGYCEPTILRTALDSVFRIDADSTVAVFGGQEQLIGGLRFLKNHLTNQRSEEALARLSLVVFQLERRFSRDTATLSKVAQGVRSVGAIANQTGDSTHPQVLTALAELYVETISHLRPRVMVQGNPRYLSQPQSVAQIRSLLFAALRAVVLWRQLGGSLWDFFLHKRAMMTAVAQRLSHDLNDSPLDPNRHP